jgi:hypothetical protein
MDTIAYHQKQAQLAYGRGDYQSAAKHLQDAAGCYSSPDKRDLVLQMATKALAHEDANNVILVEWKEAVATKSNESHPSSGVDRPMSDS